VRKDKGLAPQGAEAMKGRRESDECHAKGSDDLTAIHAIAAFCNLRLFGAELSRSCVSDRRLVSYP
jgi:hypothetical protein